MSVIKMLLLDSLRLNLTMGSLSSSALIVFQVFLLILLVDSQNLNTTSDNASNYTLYPDVVLAITGGTKSLAGEFPFMAALGWINDSGDLKFHGGGMIISPKMVLTAAHCVYKNGKLPDVVFVGGKALSEYDLYTEVFSKYSVVNVTIFPEYDPNQGYDDIALLEINQPTWFPPICLWTSQNLNSDEVTAIGYGLTEFAGLGSQQLLKVNLTAFPTDYCAPFFKRQRKFKSGLATTHICAGDKEGIKDTCQGDSGGPLITMHNNQMFAVGITSSGQACSGFPPAIYTKIYPYTEWITTVLKERGQSLQNCAAKKNENVCTN